MLRSARSAIAHATAIRPRTAPLLRRAPTFNDPSTCQQRQSRIGKCSSSWRRPPPCARLPLAAPLPLASSPLATHHSRVSLQPLEPTPATTGTAKAGQMRKTTTTTMTAMPRAAGSTSQTATCYRLRQASRVPACVPARASTRPPACASFKQPHSSRECPDAGHPLCRRRPRRLGSAAGVWVLP